MFTYKITFIFLIILLSYKLLSNDTYKINIMGKFAGETLKLLNKANLTLLRLMQHFQIQMVILEMQREEV